MWQCPLCKGHFEGMAKSAHQSNFYKSRRDMTRCDNLKLPASDSAPESASESKRGMLRVSADSPPTYEQVFLQVYDPLLDDPQDHPAEAVEEPSTQPQQVTITAPYTATPLWELARRPRFSQFTQRSDRYKYFMRSSRIPSHMMPRDMVAVHDKWICFQKNVQLCCSNDFWRFFLAMHSQPGVAIDAALGAAKNIFLKGKKGTPSWSMFPGTRRILFQKIDNLGASFYPHILHTYRIDLSHFQLPVPVKHVDFKFVDPLFAWVVVARRQRADDMHFQPAPKQNTSGTSLYGGGVQRGLAFKEACRSCPDGTHPMLFSLHWDGTGAHGVSAAPICVGVANTNNAGSSAQFCLGYMPVIPQQGRTFHSSTLATTVKFYIRQQAVGAILRVLETAAKSGVLCPFKNCHGQDVCLLLMPRLLTIPVDQPEAQMFFGMRNRWSCSKCKRRPGYSAFRQSSLQDGETVQCLYRLSDDSTSPWQARAQTRLLNYGFNPSRRCILTTVCDELLVRIPYIPRAVEVFPCVDYRDKMHGIFIFFHKVIVSGLNQIAWKAVRRGLSAKQLLDQRSTLIGYSRIFRCVDTGRSHRVQKSVFSDVNMSATDKWVLLFLLPHVFGHKGEIIPENVRVPMLTALAHVQLIILASRGRREYTKSELSQIFDKGYVEVFKALEYINQVYENSQFVSASDKHAQNPDKNPPPKRFKSKRYIVRMYVILIRAYIKLTPARMLC